MSSYKLIFQNQCLNLPVEHSNKYKLDPEQDEIEETLDEIFDSIRI
jgi:hypothetical protein